MTLREYLSQSGQVVSKFLGHYLPEMGGEFWWQETVIDKLSEQQARIADEKGFQALDDFDLAALLNILEKNWRAITSSNSGFDYRRGLNLIIELKNIRNHYAHEPSTGTELTQQLRDVDSITLLFKLLYAKPELVEQGENLRREYMMRMLGVDVSGTVEGAEDFDDSDAIQQGNVFPAEGLKESQQGIPLDWLRAGTILEDNVLEKLKEATYVGIDFGTSTSVASIATVREGGKGLETKAIDIKQFDDLGREIHSYLVDTCLAWVNGQLLFGVGAAALKQNLTPEQTIWTSFKMGLGIDLGPVYNRTALPEGKYDYTIEKPQDAAAVFLKLLCDGIREYVATNELPKKIYYTVTVPASFEPNQRNDLFNALEFAGIERNEISLMDEPNAAFLSYLIDMESRSKESRFVEVLKGKKSNVIVFDFGAGTCDISILEVSVAKDSILSRNLGISKFWALGGDDIDKAIVENILLPQLCEGRGIAKYLFTTNQLKTQVLPYLKPIAESLKIACCEIAEQNSWATIKDLKRSNKVVTTKPGKPLNILSKEAATSKAELKEWKIAEPQIRLDEFAEIMALFVAESSDFDGEIEIIDVLQPIDNAIEKIDLLVEDIDMVLFIGGSCENPLIRHSVSQHLGRFVNSVTPRDLRAHVSQGAALYTLLLRGANINPIKPITSESIYVMTVGEILEPVIKAGSEVPSKGVIKDELIVTRDGQKTIDLPFFSGSKNKLLGHITINAPKKSSGFKRGEKVKIQWSISKEKILNVEAKVGTLRKVAEFHNPQANEEITPEVLNMLKARQDFNSSILQGNGRPEAKIALTYANAAMTASSWRLAAEMFEAVEKLSPASDHSTNICYCYSMDGDRKTSAKWSKIAYERKPSAVTSYNLALDYKRERNEPQYEFLMQECLEHDPDFTLALVNYGSYLMSKGDSLGVEYLERAHSLLAFEMNEGCITKSEISTLRTTSEKLGKTKQLALITEWESENSNNNGSNVFNQGTLVARASDGAENIDLSFSKRS